VTTNKILKARVSKKRTVNTYAFLWDYSHKLLELSQNAPQGYKRPLWIGSLIFTAFTFEAYLNHIGKKLFSCWDLFEKAVNREGKLDIVCKRLGIKDFPKGKRPRQTVRKLLEFRDKLAHGKTIPLGPEITFLDADQYLERFIEEPLLAEWEKYCKESNSKIAREDIKIIIELIQEKANPEEPLFFTGLFEASASPS
jgi:hypothetical protein